MSSTDQKILALFKKEPLREMPTSSLVRQAHPEEYERILEDILKQDKKTVNQAKRRKAQLHRQTLYHITKLVDEGIIRVISIKAKGEKVYSLNIESGELIVQKRHRHIFLSRQGVSLTKIEQYRKDGRMIIYGGEDWIGKLNCIMLNCAFLQSSKLYELAYENMQFVNDCIGLYNLETVLDRDCDGILSALSRLSQDAKDFDVKICIIPAEITKARKLIEWYLERKPASIRLVVQGEPAQFLDHKILEEFSKQPIKLNIHNISRHRPPILLGKAGAYSLSDKDWESAKNRLAVGFGGVTISLDIKRIFAKHGSQNEMREIVRKTSEVLLVANNHQRRHFGLRLNKTNPELMAYASNYIRIWNYNIDDEKQAHFTSLIGSIRDELDKFCTDERAIYNCCGLPIRFDIRLSSLFTRFDNQLTPRQYSKTTVRSAKDYQNPKVTQLLTRKEDMSRVLDFDRCRIFRKGEFNSKEIWQMFNTYNLPLLTFDFTEASSEMDLTRFME